MSSDKIKKAGEVIQALLVTIAPSYYVAAPIDIIDALYIVYNFTGTEPADTKDMDQGTILYRFEVTVWASDMTQAVTKSSDMIDLLHNRSGTSSTIDYSIKYVDQYDDFNVGNNLYGKSVDFSIRCND